MQKKARSYLYVTYIANSAELEVCKECGVKQFKFLATLDLRTSDICAAMDGKIIKLEDAVPGVNVPPLHPWCRSTTIAVIDDAVTDELKRRAKDPETGEYYEVPADMTYEQWRKNLDKAAKSGIINMRFNSIADPMLEVLGPGDVSHPDEIRKFKDELKELNVRLIERETEDLGYTPGLFPGEKGELHISKGASYSAWCHEMQHMREDCANGWQGMRILEDVDEHYAREVRAYQIEIDMAEQYNRIDIAERLRENLRKERTKIYGKCEPS